MDKRNGKSNSIGYLYVVMCGDLVNVEDIGGAYSRGHYGNLLGKEATCTGCILTVFEELARYNGT